MNPTYQTSIPLCHVWAQHLFGSWLAAEVEGLDHLFQVSSESNRKEIVYLNRDEIRVKDLYGFCELCFLSIPRASSPTCTPCVLSLFRSAITASFSD